MPLFYFLIVCCYYLDFLAEELLFHSRCPLSALNTRAYTLTDEYKHAFLISDQRLMPNLAFVD